MAITIGGYEVVKTVWEGADRKYIIVRDPADAANAHLYEWSPPTADLPEITKKIHRLRSKMEVFIKGQQAYMLARSQDERKKNLEILQAEGLFPGDWPPITAGGGLPIEPVVNVAPETEKTAADVSQPEADKPLLGSTDGGPGGTENRSGQTGTNDPGFETAIPLKWMIWGLVVLIGVVMLIIILPYACLRPQTLRIGVYRSMSVTPFYVAKKRNDLSVGIERLNTLDDKHIPGEANLLLMPLVAVPRYSPALSDWRIVWVPDVAEMKLLEKKNNDDDGRYLALEDTFGKRLSQLHRKPESRDPTELNESQLTIQAEEADRVACEDPLATKLEDNYAFRLLLYDKQSPSNINVLLAKRTLIDDKNPAFPALVSFIVALQQAAPRVDDLSTSGEGDDRKQVLGDLVPGGDEKDYKAVLQHYKLDKPEHYTPKDVRDNYRLFVQLVGEDSCKSYFRSHFAQEDVKQVCGLIEPSVIKKVFDKLRLDDPDYAKDASLDRTADPDFLKDICRAGEQETAVSDFKRQANHWAEFLNNDAEQKANQMLQGLQVNPDEFYCLVGYGDNEPAEEKSNETAGLARASKVKEMFLAVHKIKEDHLFAIEMRNENQSNQRSSEQRRVEIYKFAAL